MRAGRLRHHIEFQVVTETPDGVGYLVPAWGLFAEADAAVEPLQGQELFSERQIHADVTHGIRARYLPGLTPRHRIKFGERIFDILSIRDVDERNIEIDILAKERL